MPDRVSHVKRFYGSGEGDERAWVDVERIDQLTRNSGAGSTFQATVQRIRWQDDGDDSANETRSMHTVTIFNPNGPESVDVLAIDNCAFSPRQNDGVLRKFRNRDDDDNVARETTSVRIESSDDTSQYVDVEIVDKFHDRDSDGRVIFKMRNQRYEDNANGPGGPPINPPYRLDPYQAIVGVSWGKKDHHSGKSGYDAPLLRLSADTVWSGEGWPPGKWVIWVDGLTLKIISSTMVINPGKPHPYLPVSAFIDAMWSQPYYWGWLVGGNQGFIDSTNQSVSDYESTLDSDGNGTGTTITWP